MRETKTEVGQAKQRLHGERKDVMSVIRLFAGASCTFK